MSNNRAANVQLDVVPGATTNSADALIQQLKASINEATVSAFLTKLEQVSVAYVDTFKIHADLSKKMLEFETAPNDQKEKKLDEVVLLYKNWNDRLKTQKGLGLTALPELTDDIKTKIPPKHLDQVKNAYGITTVLKNGILESIPKHQAAMRNLKARLEDLLSRQKAAGGGVQPAQPAPAAHSAPLSSSHGARNQASAQAANANNRPAQGAAVEEKKRNS